MSTNMIGELKDKSVKWMTFSQEGFQPDVFDYIVLNKPKSGHGKGVLVM